MAELLPGYPSVQNITKYVISMDVPEEPQVFGCKWYYSRQEIEDQSPSRKDGIDFQKESQLRKSYCSFLKELGMKLKVSQVAIACAMLLCHRFYMRQSHRKNDWQTIATVSLFLACKLEDTPCLLMNVIVAAYEIMYKWDPSAQERIKQREFYSKQKELILMGERLILTTYAFDLDIQLPYKPLVSALKKLNIIHELGKEAWNFVNDWLCTTLCMQYKPHYIAAGTVYLAAKLKKVKLPTEKGKVWWLEFDISPKQLEEVIQQMLRLLEWDKKRTAPPTQTIASGRKSIVSCASQGPTTVAAGGFSKSPPSINRNTSLKEVIPCQKCDSGGSSCIVEDGDGESQPRTGDSDHNSCCKIISVGNTYSKIDADRIREALKRRKRNRDANNKSAEASTDEIDSEAWIESQLESGIVVESASFAKKQRNAL
ncbi:Cyclin_N domain-containing protein [Cephalotus follicularis]|uniref:B-like cyclin n=1 Tax=Cephalotus follicularis TaxID=3775 RepID=A0A1Q3BYN5_CEPFO|nr:Cyclin_N domain-containing protein [Cephalotus follicularis]